MAKPEGGEEVVGKLPLYVKYLADPDTPYDCWFNVQDPDKPEDPPEKIGGSKLNLMAHSVVFRRMLHESPLAEKGPITIPDISPSTFRHLLRFVHSYFDVTYLNLEDAVALLCASEKYSVDDLKRRLGHHISSLLTVENIFLPMKKRECFCEETLKEAMQKIIQEQTRELVDKDEFLDLDEVNIMDIVTQDCLEISEIQLWRAVLRWGKHQGGTDKTEDLREVLTKPLKHMRFCTLDSNDFNKEVATTGVLTDGEIATVVKILGEAVRDISSLDSLNYNVAARKLFTEHEFKIKFSDLTLYPLSLSSYFYLTTEEKAVQLLSMEVRKVKSSTVNIYLGAPKKSTFKVKCSVTLTRITDYSNNSSTEEPLEFTIVEDVQLGSNYVICFPKDMKLLPLNKYKLLLTFNYPPDLLCSEKKNATLSYKYLLVTSEKDQCLHTHVWWLQYKAI